MIAAFEGFDYGLPFGWLGGGAATLVVFKTRDADVYWPGNPEIIYTKSMLDGAASVAFASSLGIGVSFAAVTVLVLQGALTLLGAQLAFLLRAEILNELTATGGLLILTIGLMLLEVKRIRVANLLPALVVVVLLTGARLSLGW